jgi:Xaa-Pro aminopeptidase
MKYEAIDSRLFTENRKQFIRRMEKNSMAVFFSNDLVPRSADAVYRWRQNPDLFYLSGVDQEESFLILFPDAPQPQFREILFVRETNEEIAVWEGEKLSKAQATEVSGIAQVMWSNRFEAMLGMLINQASTVYLNLNEHGRKSAQAEYGELRYARELREKYPLHVFRRSAPIMHELRSSKSAIEIGLMNRAIDITAKGFSRVLEVLKPGMTEYEVEAELTYTYLKNRATGHAYEPIVASGANACVLHYVSNNKPCRAGDLLLLDTGAEYANYCADLSRTIPVSGKFTARQREVYDAVLRVFKEVRSMMTAGAVLGEINREAGRIMESELIGLKLLDKTAVKKQSKDAPLFKKYYPHGVGHFLGLDVHDVGFAEAKLRKGAVLTCEPGIYIREEGIGIRLENNILVGDRKPVDLMAGIPIEAEEIETLMHERKKK